MRYGSQVAGSLIQIAQFMHTLQSKCGLHTEFFFSGSAYCLEGVFCFLILCIPIMKVKVLLRGLLLAYLSACPSLYLCRA